MDILDPNRVEMVLVKVGTRIVRPADILTLVLQVPEQAVQTARILKLKQR
jgi:hypothetical protein